MSIEPSNAYTVRIRAVMPPKPAPVIPQPNLSMAEEAKQVRARYRKTWGFFNYRAAGEDGNARRKAQAEARRDELARMALEALAQRELTSGEMREMCDASENQMRNALGWLRAEGRANFKRVGGLIKWFLPEAAE